MIINGAPVLRASSQLKRLVSTVALRSWKLLGASTVIPASPFKWTSYFAAERVHGDSAQPIGRSATGDDRLVHGQSTTLSGSPLITVDQPAGRENRPSIWNRNRLIRAKWRHAGRRPCDSPRRPTTSSLTRLDIFYLVSVTTMTSRQQRNTTSIIINNVVCLIDTSFSHDCRWRLKTRWSTSVHLRSLIFVVQRINFNFAKHKTVAL